MTILARFARAVHKAYEINQHLMREVSVTKVQRTAAMAAGLTDDESLSYNKMLCCLIPK